jgi:hypothetical protein
MRLIFYSTFVFVLISVFSCEKDVAIIAEPEDITPASLTISFEAVVNNTVVVPNTVWYSDDNFTINTLNYYISNVKLKKSDGTVYAEPDSYHLIKHGEGINSFTITNLPDGAYTGIEFLIGVDSLRNISGAQTGALDVAEQMFWDWNTGYIFLKLEGEYISAEVPNGNFYAIHIGGFEGEFSCLQKVTLPLNTNVVAKKGRKCKINFETNVEELFDNPKKIGFDYYYGQLKYGPQIFTDISRNYTDMFSIKSVTN